MSTRRILVKVVLVIASLVLASPARAGTTLPGANTDFPDDDLVMPFATTDFRSTFFSTTNIGEGIIRARWAFFDANGQKVDEVLRDIFGEGGTDIVDITSIADRTIDGNGNFVLGPSRSLAGRNGFVIVYGDGTPRLLGNFTVANLLTSSGFGVNASGFGTIGTVAAGQGIIGTTFNPATLQDNLLVIIGLNAPPSLNSLTNGSAASGTVFSARVILLGNDPNEAVIAETTVPVRGSALITNLRTLFPSQNLDGSASILVVAEGTGIIGYYGQAVGAFGAAQSLRAGVAF
ncbi:MAG: hypothetical protein FJ148_06370 [Deltaproteobacteria bacterium]|nr:hypothetical protein [Deltaproteobacteria bacterium]